MPSRHRNPLTFPCHCDILAPVAMTRPCLADVTRYLDQLAEEQTMERWLLEDLAGIEDGPETDETIQRSRWLDDAPEAES